MYRIKRYPRGWVVEQKHKTWTGKTYWKHCISVAGIDSLPWYHTSYDFALESLINKIKEDTAENSDACNNN